MRNPVVMMVLIVLFIALLAFVAKVFVQFFESRQGASKAEIRRLRNENIKMKSLLRRLSSDSVGAPALESQILLEELEER